MIHIYTGNGKGKTTSALGLIVRALGHKKRVCLIQFMKKDDQYGEILFFKNNSISIDIFQYGTDNFVDPTNPQEIDKQQANLAYIKAIESIESNQYDLIVLDEINVAVKWELITIEMQKKLFDFVTDAEIVMTGRCADIDMINMADLVTEMKEIKHYFNAGQDARKGIEY